MKYEITGENSIKSSIRLLKMSRSGYSPRDCPCIRRIVAVDIEREVREIQVSISKGLYLTTSRCTASINTMVGTSVEKIQMDDISSAIQIPKTDPANRLSTQFSQPYLKRRLKGIGKEQNVEQKSDNHTRSGT